MSPGRLEAFSDGVIAILITIMVLGLHVPKGSDWAALRTVLPTFLAYVLSFVFLGIYWNNHHHLLSTLETVNGAVLWANLHLLFWLSMIPFATAWLGENAVDSLPTAVYGAVGLMALSRTTSWRERSSELRDRSHLLPPPWARISRVGRRQ